MENISFLKSDLFYFRYISKLCGFIKKIIAAFYFYPFFCFLYSRGDIPMILLKRREK